MKNTRPWNEETIIAIDLETTGKYPLESEICEIAAAKWTNGEFVDEFQTLVKPSKKMSEEVIKIHNITNEMVETAPSLSLVLPRFREFIDQDFLVAHHAPFDMGFLAMDFEQFGLPLPKNFVFCSSLLSRKLFPECTNHRLQTLITELNLNGGVAHRALDDAKACLQLTLKCFERAGKDKTFDQLFKNQGKGLDWKNFSMLELSTDEVFGSLVRAIREGLSVDMVYKGGSSPGKSRRVEPIGLVRGPSGDFLVAIPLNEIATKRYYLNKISKVST